jgi:hypothetical protein
MATLQPAGMSAAEFWRRIDSAKGDRYLSSSSIDWGRGKARGQGKRSGGMVMGAMGDAPQGVKTYHFILGKAPLSAEDKAEAASLEPHQQMLIARALEAGFSAKVAMLVGYTAGPDPISRHECFRIAQDIHESRGPRLTRRNPKENEMHITEDSKRNARVIINRAARVGAGAAVTEYMNNEDELAACVGLGAGAVNSKMSDMGFTQQSDLTKDFPSGKIMVYSAPNPENPGEVARVFCALKGDTCVLMQNDATPNLDPEALDTSMSNMAKQLGLTRPADSQAQPGDGGTGFVAGMA